MPTKKLFIEKIASCLLAGGIRLRATGAKDNRFSIKMIVGILDKQFPAPHSVQEPLKLVHKRFGNYFLLPLVKELLIKCLGFEELTMIIGTWRPQKVVPLTSTASCDPDFLFNRILGAENIRNQ